MWVRTQEEDVMPIKHRVLAGLAAVSLTTAGAVALTTGPAAASCGSTYVDTTDLFADPSGPDYYYYPGAHRRTVDCRTISIRVLSHPGLCAYWRIRFFPSSGGSYAQPDWKPGCHNQAVNVATSVTYGTEYRVESTHPRQFRGRH
jgi:hypothetical protein